MDSFLEKETVFEFNELFFSRTNRKGIIESGNSVFQRVSKYEWDEILQKPHNCVRHPSMPRGVFHLLWETILDEKPVGAYVINQAKDGSYYWVFAMVLPIEDGFLSVRLKPSCPIFEIVKKKYAELLETEQKKKIAPKESQALLLTEIQNLNFRNYRHFMTEALTQELESRQKFLGLGPIRVISQLREVLRLGTDLNEKCKDIFSAYRKSVLVPLNLEIQAARIGDEAAPIAVISSQYDGLAKQIQVETQKFVAAGNLMQEKVQDCQFEVCNSLLQKEMVLFFRAETKETPIDKKLEMSLLEALGRYGVEQARISLSAIDTEFGKFNNVFEEVRKLMTALEIVSITGKIEAAKLTRSSDDLQALLSELASFKLALKKSLYEIEEIGRDLIKQTHQMKEQLT